MRYVRRLGVVGAVCALVSGGLVGCSSGGLEDSASGAQAPASQPVVDSGQQAQEILQQRCVVCHTAERFEKVPFTPTQWNTIVDRMVTKGAQLSAEEREVLRHWKDL